MQEWESWGVNNRGAWPLELLVAIRSSKFIADDRRIWLPAMILATAIIFPDGTTQMRIYSRIRPRGIRGFVEIDDEKKTIV